MKLTDSQLHTLNKIIKSIEIKLNIQKHEALEYVSINMQKLKNKNSSITWDERINIFITEHLLNNPKKYKPFVIEI
jgi:hypothetical protein